MYKASQNRLRMRMYNVLKDIKRQHAYVPIVIRPALSPDYRPRVNWSNFHETVPLEQAPSLYKSTLAPRTLADGPGTAAISKMGRGRSCLCHAVRATPLWSDCRPPCMPWGAAACA